MSDVTGSRRRVRRTRVHLTVWVVALLTAVAFVPTAQAARPASHPGCDHRTNNTYAKLLECVTVEGAHQA